MTTGRFVKGTTDGKATRWRPGQSGNPRGRPRSVGHYAQAIAATNPTPGDLRRVMADPAMRPREREAARRLLVAHLVNAGPMPGSDSGRAYRKYRWTSHKKWAGHVAVRLDLTADPDRREAARLRLAYWSR